MTATQKSWIDTEKKKRGAEKRGKNRLKSSVATLGIDIVIECRRWTIF